MRKLTRIVRRAVLASTQDEAKRLAESGAPDRTVVTAARQTRGRGREDRTWASPPGGLYLSLILRPKIPPAKLAGISLRIGRELAKRLRRYGIDTKVKAPNDILARPKSVPSVQSVAAYKKLAGILIESRSSGKIVDWLVVGVGLNVNNALPPGLEACSLRSLTGKRQSLQRAFHDVTAVLLDKNGVGSYK